MTDPYFKTIFQHCDWNITTLMKMNTALEMTLVIVGLQVLVTQFPYVSGKVMVFNDINLQNRAPVNENETISNVGPDRLIYLKQSSDEAHLLKDYKQMNQFDLHEEIGSNRMSRNVEVVRVSLDTSRIINVVDDCFLSFALDSFLMDPSVHWLKFNFRFVFRLCAKSFMAHLH